MLLGGDDEKRMTKQELVAAVAALLPVRRKATVSVGTAEASARQQGHEALADGLETSERDDSFAVEHSILKVGDLQMETKSRPVSWLVLWVLNAVGFFLACIVVPYRRWVPCVVPEEKLGRPNRWFDRVIRRAFAAVIRPVKGTRQLVGPYALNCVLGRLIHPIVKTIRETPTTSQALDAVYTAHVVLGKELKRWWRINPLRLPGTLLAYYVMSTVPPAAVRNRLRMVYRKALLPELDRLYWECRLWLPGSEPIDVFVEACGSAEAEVYGVYQFLKVYPHAKVRVHLVDLSTSSLRRAKRLAESLGVGANVVCIKADLKKHLRELSTGSVKVLEMVGFLDYRDWESLVGLCREIRRAMAPSGMFVSAHIAKTNQDFMLRYLIGWPELVHRTREEFGEAFSEAGWEMEEQELLEYEPLRGHIVAVYRRGGKRQ